MQKSGSPYATHGVYFILTREHDLSFTERHLSIHDSVTFDYCPSAVAVRCAQVLLHCCLTLSYQCTVINIILNTSFEKSTSFSEVTTIRLFWTSQMAPQIQAPLFWSSVVRFKTFDYRGVEK
eukprot:GHVH01006645.1.p1 GENE.GHVH01006645.1~~GHVH01006645.1.p1  ORF type:complete len:122 (-),score=5.07 GHVH01006645.1:740-1105(-)